MATLTVQTFSELGLTATYASCAGGGDVVANNGDTVLHVKNGSGGSITVTVTKQSSATINDPVYGVMTKANVAVAIGAGAEAFIGPFKVDGFNNSSGQIAITYSGVTSLTIVAIKK
jgi:hypothetical protein